jgi:N-acetylmuramoyl-L-alanine amidase
MPAILFEASFVSNPDDESRLRAPHFQHATSTAIVDAVEAWLDRQKEN